MLKSNEPLGLPAGSVRALLTLIVLVTVCILTVKGVPVPDILRDAVMTMLGLYFGTRAKAGAAIPVEDEETK